MLHEYSFGSFPQNIPQKISSSLAYEPFPLAEFSDTEQAKVGDYDLPALKENILALQIFVHDPLGM